MNLTSHFSVGEFVHSETATRLGLENDLPVHLIANARRTAEMLERIRAFLSARVGREIPIVLTSGYRSLPVNRAIGSGDSSDHVNADAADWRAPAFGSPAEVCKVLAPAVDDLGIGQLINEFPDRRGWVHTSTRLPSKAINRVITISGAGTFPGIRA